MKMHLWKGVERVLLVASCIGITRPAAAGLKAVLISSALARPVFVTSPPGDYQRLFVVEQFTGRIRIIRNAAITGTFLTIDNLDLATERGLLGLAFHPQYSVNRKFYVYYTSGPRCVI